MPPAGMMGVNDKQLDDWLHCRPCNFKQSMTSSQRGKTVLLHLVRLLTKMHKRKCSHQFQKWTYHETCSLQQADSTMGQNAWRQEMYLCSQPHEGCKHRHGGDRAATVVSSTALRCRTFGFQMPAGSEAPAQSACALQQALGKVKHAVVCHLAFYRAWCELLPAPPAHQAQSQRACSHSGNQCA